MSLQVVGDVAGMWEESVNSVSSGMSGLGAEGLAGSTQDLAAALSLLSGTAQIFAGVTALLTIRNAISAADLSARVAAMSANPIAWPMLALGVAVGAAGAALVYSFVREYTIRSDLSTGSGALIAATQVGVLT